MTPVVNELMVDSPIGEIPTMWEVAPFGELFDIQQGKALNKKAREGRSPKPFLRTSNVFWGELSLDTVDQMDFTPDEQAKYTLLPNDLLVCEGGDIGRTAVWAGELAGCHYQNHLHRCRAIGPSAHPAFFMYWMQHAFVQRRLYEGQANVTTIANLSKSRLASFNVAVPPLAEQRAIAHVLRTVQQAREATEQVIAAATELKRSMMQHLFTYGPVPIDQWDDSNQVDTDAGPLPRRWQLIPLGEVCGFTGGSQPPKRTFAYEPKPGFVRLLQIRDFDTDKHATYVEQGRQRLRMVSASDVLIGRYGASVGRILRGKSGAINVAIVKTLPDESRILSDYLYYLLQGGRFQTFVTSLGGRAAQAGFNKGELNPFPIGLPGIDEQHQIVKVLATLDRKLTAEEQRRDALDALFSSLLHDLMTARVRVPVSEFAEVAS